MATKKTEPVEERVRPIKLHDPDNGDEFVLEFNRESVKFAESRGFKIEDVGDFPMTKIPEFFWFAFRMHHPRISKEQAERILYDDLGGVPEGLIEQLGKLYLAPFEALQSNGDEKNGRMTVEF